MEVRSPDVSLNGQTSSTPDELVLRPLTLKRMARLFARMEGAQAAAQAALAIYDQARQTAFQAALEALEDEGLPPPPARVRTEFDASRGRLIFVQENA